MPDVRALVELQLKLPQTQQRSRSRGCNELLANGQLLGEHLFVHDYSIRSNDTLHFVVPVIGQ